jgi:1,4-alpha-glucan branching enzyme
VGNRAALALAHIQTIAARDPTAENSYVKFLGHDQVIHGNNEMIQRSGYIHDRQLSFVLSPAGCTKRALSLSR